MRILIFLIIFNTIPINGQNNSLVDKWTGFGKYKFGMTRTEAGCPVDIEDRWCQKESNNSKIGGFPVTKFSLVFYKSKKVNGFNFSLSTTTNLEDVYNKLKSKYGNPDEIEYKTEWYKDTGTKKMKQREVSPREIDAYIWNGNNVQLEFRWSLGGPYSYVSINYYLIEDRVEQDF